jgi:hypothetical protein
LDQQITDRENSTMKPKTKPEPKTQFKMTISQSVAAAFEATRKEADDLGFDWTATMLEPMVKRNSEFSQFLAQHRAKVQPQVQPDADLNGGHKISHSNGPDPDRA